jgi:hypothetical protein
MSGCLQMTYGGYRFDPVPIFQIQTDTLKTPEGSGFGYKHNITLEGSIISMETNQIEEGINWVVKSGIEDLYSGLEYDGDLFLIQNTGTTGIIMSGYPTINNVTINDAGDQYVRRANYTVSMEMVDLNGYRSFRNRNSPFPSGYPEYIESVSETWDVAIDDDKKAYTVPASGVGHVGFVMPYVLAVTHTVEVTARTVYTGVKAKNNLMDDCTSFLTGQYLSKTLMADNLRKHVLQSGLLGVPWNYSGFEYTGIYNHYRTISQDKTNGKVTATETFLVANDTTRNTNIPGYSNQLVGYGAYEKYTSSANKEDALWEINVQGEVQGFDKLTYDFGPAAGGKASMKKFAYENASGHFYAFSLTQMLSRATSSLIGAAKADQEFGGCGADATPPTGIALNPIPKSRSIGFNADAGSISYDFTFEEEKAITIKTTGTACILSQTIGIDITNPTDVFAEQTILGRAAGPLLQDLGTKTLSTVIITVETISPPPTSLKDPTELFKFIPKGEVAKFGQDYITNIVEYNGANNQSFKIRDEESMGITEGRYTRVIGYAYGNCSGT